MPKKILFFGIYDRTYARTKVLQNGFKRNGWTIEECHLDPRINRGVIKYFKLAWMGLKARGRKPDLVLVGFPGHTVVWLARILFGPRIIFDAFLSLYESNVIDRKVYPASSWRARKDRFFDSSACRLAGTVLLDTANNIDYFVKEYGIPKEKFVRVFVGADDTIFYPVNTPRDSVFIAHFHGTFIPVQGISHIVEAADILRNSGIKFRIVGSGQDAKRIDPEIQRLKLESTIERVAKVPVEKIPEYMANADVVFGIFGDIDRAKRAIPNKVYEAMAMGKAIITEDGSGIRELPNPEKMFLLVPPGDGNAIAKAVEALARDPEMGRKLGDAARDFFVNKLMPEKLIADLLAAPRLK